jgi:hypothetical protein
LDNLNPISEVRINDFIKIASKSWPKDHFREIYDINVIKEFYNTSYNHFHYDIEKILDNYHPASWVRIAYTQLELWTVEFFKVHHSSEDFSTVPNLFIPIARYGWRYIAEISLENLEFYEPEKYTDERPDDNEISKIFTLLIGLSYTTELSNYLHYFKERFKNSKITFSPNLYSTFPELDADGEIFIKEFTNYIRQEADYDLTPEFNYREDKNLLNQIDLLLTKYFQFNLKDIEIISDVLSSKVTHEIGATNLIMPTNELIVMLSEYTNLNVEKIARIVNFIFLDTSKYNHEKRDYLKRSQNTRLLNYSGCKFKLNNNLKTIYSHEASEWKHIKSSIHHSIISFVLLEEWRLNFITRLVFGQRIDLKSISKGLKDDISKIEKYFHKNIFENAIKNILIQKGLQCQSLDKIGKDKIVCGEIDAISVDRINKIVYLIEAKNISPSRDAKALGQIISDHFKQKEYHRKFLGKIDWTEKNTKVLSDIFGVNISNDFVIEKYFITGTPSPVKFLIDEYNVITFFEFFNLISKRYEKSKY